jgi:hypothetical protein
LYEFTCICIHTCIIQLNIDFFMHICTNILSSLSIYGDLCHLDKPLYLDLTSFGSYTTH